jgi:UDP-N-acetylglucosamine 2-epimerase (non-hydrolysing)
VITHARSTRAFEVSVLATAQHRELLDQTMSVFGISPDYDLDLMTPNQSLSTICTRVITGVDGILQKESPDLVMVQGDTVTTFAAALAAYYRMIRVAHVEAGLRSHDRFNPFPEEINRSLISRFSDFNFCPTESAKQNLLNEGIDPKTIFVTGNTVIDTLLSMAKRPHVADIDVLKRIDPKQDKIILVTTHRRESFGKPIQDVLSALREVAGRNPDVHIIIPVHPNPNVRGDVERMLGGHERIHLIPPVPYLDFIELLKRSYLIVSDSGGICEEAPSLGKPVLLIREVTERPEALSAGTARLVGTDFDTMVEWIERLLTDPDEYKKFTGIANPFGDGQAAGRIIDILKERL